MQPAREVAQLGLGLAELVAGEAQDVGGLVARRSSLRWATLSRFADGHEPLLRAVVQVAPDAPALGIGGLDHARARAPQRGRLMAALELGRRPRREDAHRGDVVVPGRHRPRVHHGHVAEVRAVGRAQADREVALEAHVDRRLGLREALRQRLRERDDRIAPRPARTACRCVSYSNGSSIQSPSYQPLTTRTCSPSGSRGLRDERELRVERQRDVTDQAAKELVSDRTRGPLGNGAKQVPAAEPRARAGRCRRKKARTVMPPPMLARWAAQTAREVRVAAPSFASYPPRARGGIGAPWLP